MKLPGFSAETTVDAHELYSMPGVGGSAENTSAVIPQLCASSPCIGGEQVQCCLNFQFGWPPLTANCGVSHC